MSAGIGIFNFDDTPVDRSVVITMEQMLARRPNDWECFESDSLAMVYRASCTERDSSFGAQPHVTSSGHVLFWNGRLDNREELIFSLRDQLDEDKSDAAILMAGFLKWNINFLPRILGDFALAFWNPFSRSLILARDVIGARSIYYHTNQHSAIWSTELDLLLDLMKTPLEINDEYIAGFLSNLPDPGQTPYKGLIAVSPAHAVIINSRNVQVQRFWAIDPEHKIRYKSDAEYEDHFRQLFREAVRCRLSVNTTVWSELSGGLDSSSIVCMANDIIRSGDAKTPGLQTVSRVFDEASKSDERKYICSVEKKIGRQGIHLREDDYRILAPWTSEYVPTIPNYIANVSAYYKAVNKAMCDADSRVLLSGVGGGEIFLGDGSPFSEMADLLVEGKLLRLHRRARVWSEALSKPYFQLLWREIIIPLLPHKLQISSNRSLDKILRFYNQDFVVRMDLRKRMFGPSDEFGFRRPGGRSQSISFLYAQRQISAGWQRELCDVEFSYPFTHRPLIEFMLAIPAEQKARPGESKSLLRRALRDLLPEEVLNRKGRRTIWPAAARAAIREQSRIYEMFKDSRSAAYGYLNAETILEACAPTKEKPTPYVISLVPFEHWLKSVEHRRKVRKPRQSAARSVMVT